MQYLCSLCSEKISGDMMIYREHMESHIVDLVKRDHPDWVEKNGMCKKCMDYYRAQLKGAAVKETACGAKPPQKIYGLIATAALFGIYLLYCLWMMANEKPILWSIVFGLETLVFAACLWGLKHLKYWALFLSRVLMLAALGLGIYLVRFVWTFWIFEQPTVMDRIMNALNPRVSIFVIFPVFWFVFFSRPRNNSLFKK